MQTRYLWRALSYRWRRNRAEIEALKQHIRPGDSVVDIGSHKGGFLYWLRRYVGPSGRVTAFEPQPQMASYLRGIIAAQHWTNVTVEEAALSSTSGSRPLFVPAPTGHASPGARLSDVPPATTVHETIVKVLTLDDFVDAGGPSISCIKCDCEGHELEVFLGAERVLQEHRPVLLFECEARHLTARTPADVFRHLHARRYRGWFFSPSGLQPIEQFRLDVHQPVRAGRFWQAPDYCNNFLFVPAEREEKAGTSLL